MTLANRWFRSFSRRSVTRPDASRRARRHFFEPLEPRQMLASVPVAQHDPLYATPLNTDLVISAASSGLVNNDFDADGDSLSASVVDGPANGSLISFNSNGTFTYRPDTSFSGIDTFTYKVSDGTNDSNLATVTIAVAGNFGPQTNLDAIPQGGLLMTGGLTLTQPLTLGQQLVYRSETVDPYPVVVLETSLVAGSSVPDSIDAQLTFGGIAGSVVSYDTTGLSAGDPLRFVLQLDASTLDTGYYDYTIELTAWFGLSSVSREYSGAQAVVNRTESEYGAGWWLDGLDSLVVQTGGALLVRGNGDSLWFAEDGVGGFLPATGDLTYSTLVENGGGTFTLTSKQGIEWEFSAAGLLTSVTDTNGNSVSYSYADRDSDSVADELIEILDPFARDTDFSYTSGQVTSFIDHAGRTTTLGQSSGLLNSVTHPDPDGGGALAAPVTEYAYDNTTSLLTIWTDALNNDTTYGYDADSLRISSINHPNSTGWSLTPVQTIGLATGTGNSLSSPTDAEGQYTDERGKVWKFVTDRFGNLTYFEDPLGNVTAYERDLYGNVIQMTEADPDGGGSLTSPVTKYGYSASGDLVRQYLPDGHDQQWTYNGLHRILTFTNELDHTWEYTYDADGNRLTEEDPLGNVTTYTYTLSGRVADITTPDPDGAGGASAAVTEFEYDGYGRLDTITYADTTTREFSYNSADRQLTMTDELSNVWTQTWDALDRLTSVTDAESATTSFSYNANGWKIKETDALSNETDYTYNERGWVTEVERPDPDGGGSLGRPTSTYSYNATGQLSQEGQPSYFGGGNVQRTYDDAGRLTAVSGPIANVGTSYTLDNLGRVTQESRYDSMGTYSYTKYVYNSRGLVVRSIQSHPTASPVQDGPETTFTYDAAGQLLTTTDPLNNTTSYAYNARGQITSTSLPDPDGSGGLTSPVTTYEYDPLGRQSSLTDPLGRVTTYEYDSRDRLLTITQPDPDGAGSATAPVTQFSYDDAGRRTAITDPLNRVTSYTFDDVGRVLTSTAPDPDGAGGLASPVSTFTYNALGSIATITDPLGNVTSFTYDNLQRQTVVTQPDPDGGGGLASPVTTYTYNAQGLLAEITDPLGRDTTFGYDSYGRRTTVTNHEGKTTTTAYDSLGRVTSITTPDPDGAGAQTASTTSYAYDRWDRVSTITDPRSGNTYFTYDVRGKVLTLDDASGNTTTWTYDGVGRVVTETNELNITRSFAYDAAGNLVRTLDRNGRIIRHTVDGLDRISSETWYSGGTPLPSSSVATTTQGGAINEVQRVGHSGASFGQFSLSFSGQTTSTIPYNATAGTVQTALEALSNIDVGDVTVTKLQNGPSHEWQVTFGGALAATNVAQITVNTAGLFGGGPTAIQATDIQGGNGNDEVQTITVSNANGGTFRLAFGNEWTTSLDFDATSSEVETALEGLDAIDNVTVSGSAGGPYTITFGGAQAGTNVPQIGVDDTLLTSGTLERTISYAYDAASQLTSASDPDSEYAYMYDNLGRVLTTSNAGTPGVPTVVLNSTYDANSRRTSLAAEVDSVDDLLNSSTYDSLGRMTRVEQTGQSGGNTVAEKRVDFAYNALGQFAEIVRQAKPSSTWDEVVTSTYTYDTLNRLTDLDHTHGMATIADYEWTYDYVNRVTEFSGPDGTSDYTYDKESQLTAVDHSYQSDESYTYNATGNRTGGGYSSGTNNRMLSDGTYNYSYDDEGNRLTRTRISDDYVTRYEWDFRNRLTAVTDEDDSTNVLSMVEYTYDLFDRRIDQSVDADGPGGNDPVVTRYVYDGDHILLTFDDDGDLTNRYLNGPAIDQILADEDASGDILWPLTDNLGTVRDLVESDGTVANHLEYDAFGNVTAESNGAIDHLFAYTGRERDEETGLQYHRARYYDPATGRFISHDPASFAAGDANLSRYVGNRSTNAIDPTGYGSTLASLTYTPTAGYRLFDASDPAYRFAYQAFLDSTPRFGTGNARSPSPSNYALYMTLFAASPVVGFTMWANGMTTEDLMLMGRHPGATAQGAATGAMHGQMMVWNEATFHLISPLNDHVDYLVEQNGGTYGTAQASAGWGVSAAYGLLPCGYISNTVRVFETIANTRDIYEGYQDGNIWQMAGGILGVGTNAAGNWCFVAGTQVVVGENPLPGSVEVTIANEPTGERNSSVLGWSLFFVGIGLAGTELRRRRKGSEVSHQAKPHSDRRRLPTDDLAPGDLEATDQLFTDSALLDSAPSLAESLSTDQSEHHEVLRPKAITSALDRTTLAVATCCKRSSALLGLAASLLVAALLTLGGVFDTGSATRSQSSNAHAALWETQNIEDLQVGDLVLAWDEVSGRQTLQPIDRIYRRVADHLQHVTVRSSDGKEQTLHTTDEHPFWVPDRGWVPAGKLATGDILRQTDGSYASVTANRYEPHPEGVQVFNLRVKDSHTYFATNSQTSPAVLVHNANYEWLESISWGRAMHQIEFPGFLEEIVGIRPNHMILRVQDGITGVDMSLIEDTRSLYTRLGFDHAELKPNTPWSIEHFYEQMSRWELNNVGLFLYEPQDTRIIYNGLYSSTNGVITHIPHQ